MVQNLVTRAQLKEIASLPEVQKYFSHVNQYHNEDWYSFRCTDGFFEIYYEDDEDFVPSIYILWDGIEDEIYYEATKIDKETIKYLILRFDTEKVHSIMEFVKKYELTREDWEYLKNRKDAKV